VRISILTLNPGFFEGPLGEGMIRIAREKGIVDVAVISIRDFAADRYGTTDDTPYGGGAGMVMKADTIVGAHESALKRASGLQTRTLVTTPQGRPFTQGWARDLKGEEHLVLVCGRYKGIDERAIPLLKAEEISIGDYVLSGGEAAALVIVDALARLQPGVLGDSESAEADSFSEALLDAPVYTRPEEFRGHRVPDILLSGNHEQIRRWRRREALRRTRERRPDLLSGRTLSEEDRKLLNEIEEEAGP
jgi:tRNA (guanine37-N1)-methyltransferase